MNLLFVVLSSQLLYYLLIAQTGVVGAFDSHIHDLYTLPIGGVLGSLFSAFWKHDEIRGELYFLFGIQVFISWFYPDYSLGMLLSLGFVVGYTTPLLLHLFYTQSKGKLALGLAISYAVGTALYTYPFLERGDIAIILPLISVIALRFSSTDPIASGEQKPFRWDILAIMMLWIFTDSALFETLSRSGGMDVWSRYTGLIIASHLVGVYLAYRQGGDLLSRTRLIWVLFVVSYGLYWFKEPLLLSIVYPIVISYYNVLLFQTLIGIGDVRRIAFSMIGVGWIATSAANGVALEHRFWIATTVLGMFGMIYLFYTRRII